MTKFYRKQSITNHIYNAEVPPNQCNFLKFTIKIEMVLIQIEGMRALAHRKNLIETLPQFNSDYKNTNTLKKL